jgi:esterase
MLGSSRNWQTAGRDLAVSRRVYALDLRNHGLSPHADSMSYGEMAADVLAWLDANGLGRADLIGHSMGGRWRCCSRAGNPERVRRLVVVDIAPETTTGPRAAPSSRR